MQHFVVSWLARIRSRPPPGEGVPSTATMRCAASSRRQKVIYRPTTGAPPPEGIRLTNRILEILPYWSKYSVERRVGMSYTIFNSREQDELMVANLLLGKSRTDSDNV